jgi:hypothetical protein
LRLGVRLLQVQAHMDNEEIHFCHTSCVRWILNILINPKRIA